MKQELIITAKSVEEARKKAAAELDAREEDLVVTVLEEGKRGFLGIGSLEAKIAVSYTAPEKTTGEEGNNTGLIIGIIAAVVVIAVAAVIIVMKKKK